MLPSVLTVVQGLYGLLLLGLWLLLIAASGHLLRLGLWATRHRLERPLPPPLLPSELPVVTVQLQARLKAVPS